MDKSAVNEKNNLNNPQCQFFVLRKKRLCRMTVKPGRQYCGEHEPQPKSDDGKDDTRIPCPNDPKHTCYASKLEKHLSICNAREQEQPDYILRHINDLAETDDVPRLPLSKIPLETILEVIEKVNILYDKHVKDNITTLPEKAIHASVLEDFQMEGRTESSLRHLRQASRLLHLIEEEQLVGPNTCFVELGAGKGHLSYYAWRAWGQRSDADVRVVLVDRASLRHKRDNKLRGAGGAVQRVRADLAHLRLESLPAVGGADRVVGYAKHLCGVATDYALRGMAPAGRAEAPPGRAGREAPAGRARGLVLATCCHHRCGRAAAASLLDLGISLEEFNVMLGIVSWATCGDGRARDRRRATPPGPPAPPGTRLLNLQQQERELIGRRAKALIDWGRVLYLRQHGFHARLVHYVPTSVSLENVCIVAKKNI